MVLHFRGSVTIRTRAVVTALTAGAVVSHIPGITVRTLDAGLLLAVSQLLAREQIYYSRLPVLTTYLRLLPSHA